MPTHWNTAIERLDEGKILEDFLPERDKYSYIINKFILSDKSDIRYETKFIADIQVNICTKESFNEFKQSFKGLSCYHCDYDILVII